MLLQSDSSSFELLLPLHPLDALLVLARLPLLLLRRNGTLRRERRHGRIIERGRHAHTDLLLLRLRLAERGAALPVS